MLSKFDQIILEINCPEYKLQKGAIGVVTFIDKAGIIDVEFYNIIGNLIAVIKLNQEHVRKINTVKIFKIKNFNLN
jgi:hypothetical protein